MYVRYIKRLLDIVLSLLAILVLSPLLLILIFAVKIDSKGPVFFMQKRVGRNKQHFNIIKFRTMSIDTPKDTPTHLLENPDKYITTMGRFLRHTSFDELPQLFNILVGEMSIVGPRPALYNQYDLLTLRDKYDVNALVPGLTGYAQVNGRDELPIPIKANLDGYYARNISFCLDVKIVFQTVFNVFTAKGVVEGKNGEVMHTERLILRQLRHDDLNGLKEMLQNPTVMKPYEGIFSDDECVSWLEKQLKRYNDDGFGIWAVILKDEDVLIGQAGITMQDIGELYPVCEVGYIFKEKYWHKGYATEAASACKEYAFNVLKFEKVYSIIRDSNIASQNVALRNSMKKEGEFIKHYRGLDMLHFIYSTDKTKTSNDN